MPSSPGHHVDASVGRTTQPLSATARGAAA